MEHRTPLLIDSHGRILRDLRVSVTDRCNFRCLYCLPETEAAANFYRGRWAVAVNATPIALLGLVMERHSLFPHEEWRKRFYPFWSPRDFRDVLLSGDPIMEEDIIAEGFVPISNESEGDQWITRLNGDANSPILLFSLSDMERLPVCGSMAELMALMSVSEESTNEV